MGRDLHLIADPLRLAASVPQAAALLIQERPAAIFTTGGYVAIPTLLAATVLRIPVVLWDGNVVPGRSVRVTARLATALAVSFAATCSALDGAGRPCYVTGTPIRPTDGVDRTGARDRLGIPADERLLLIFGGSQAVRRFNRAVSGALRRLIEMTHVIHVTGDEGFAEAEADRTALPETLRSRYRPHRFLREGMSDALAAADLVVGRAGSSTLAEAAAFAVPLILVPYPHAAGHQRANAVVFVEAGAARLIDDAEFDADSLLAAAGILVDGPALGAMAAAARSLGRPDAAGAVADLVIALADRRGLPGVDAIDDRSRGTAA